MAMLSALRTSLRPALGQLAQQMQQKRFAGHGHTMHIWSSRFMWHKFKNMLHLYTLVGAIPLVTIAMFVNLFVGTAEINDTPEGFVPAPFENERHPIARFIQRYLYNDPIAQYETRAGLISRLNDRRLIGLATRDVKQMMKKQADYRDEHFWPNQNAMFARYNRATYEAKSHAISMDK